jgi:hypothetical protein
MNDLVQPEWMQGFTPTHPPGDGSPGNPTWKRGGPSPNPAGRPKGTLSKRDKIAQALNDDGPAVARVVIDAALAGDMQPTRLEYGCATLASQHPKQQNSCGSELLAATGAGE